MLCWRSCTATCTWSLFIFVSFDCYGLTGGRRARLSAAAVVGQEADERVHAFEIGGVDDEASVLAAFREAGSRKPGEVERERRRREFQLFADASGSHASGSRLDQQPEDREARGLGQRAEGLHCLHRFHISRIMEIMGDVK